MIFTNNVIHQNFEFQKLNIEFTLFLFLYNLFVKKDVCHW